MEKSNLRERRAGEKGIQVKKKGVVLVGSTKREEGTENLGELPKGKPSISGARYVSSNENRERSGGNRTTQTKEDLNLH